MGIGHQKGKASNEKPGGHEAFVAHERGEIVVYLVANSDIGVVIRLVPRLAKSTVDQHASGSQRFSSARLASLLGRLDRHTRCPAHRKKTTCHLTGDTHCAKSVAGTQCLEDLERRFAVFDLNRWKNLTLNATQDFTVSSARATRWIFGVRFVAITQPRRFRKSTETCQVSRQDKMLRDDAAFCD